MSSSRDAIVIPTRSFYSARPSPQSKSPKHLISPKESGKSPTISHSPKAKRRSFSNPIKSSINTNKGVRHHIRRPRHDSSRSIKIDSILSNIRNENLRDRIESNRQKKKQIQEVHNILRECQNPIELARPLRALNMSDDSNNNKINDSCKNNKENPTGIDTGDFSDLDSSSDDMSKLSAPEIIDEMDQSSVVSATNEENVEAASTSTSRPVTPNENRKFFKSRHTAGIAKYVKITENIRAMVCNGKITLTSEKRKKVRRPSTAANFSVAQAAVDVIIKNLDDKKEPVQSVVRTPNIDNVKRKEDILEELERSDELLNEIELLETTYYSDFRKRIPYNTDDPAKIEEQHFLLDFLISHNICNENNFNIFIGDPENYRSEATAIVNEVLQSDTGDDDFRGRIPFNTDDPTVIEQQKHHLEFLTTHNLLTEENFDIFIANYEKRREEAEAIFANVLSNTMEDVIVDTIPLSNTKEDSNSIVDQNVLETSCRPIESATLTSDNTQNLFPIFYPGQCQPLIKNVSSRKRVWNGGNGFSQYQIDAGQKEFGAKQCKQCGLVYGVHEPEEEKLHRDFHSSLHVLRFKGWIDEDRIADYPEWGRDGRIIRITDATNIKRRERLNEILKIVDKELGFSSYIIPKTFVAYLAIRNCLIVGFCLVQPLEKANRYICSNGVDCSTIEEFEAKCGISRIWVAPLHRRMHIAQKLLKAVQVNTIMGEEIPLNKIAFSAPTEDGKRFAQKVMGTESFLVYQ